VVLRFYSWQTIALVRPEYREEGFLRYLQRDELAAVFDRLGVGHDLAVVVWGWMYTEQQTAELLEEWQRLFKGQGFKRLVCLLSDGSKRIDGLVVLHDLKLTDGGPPSPAS